MIGKGKILAEYKMEISATVTWTQTSGSVLGRHRGEKHAHDKYTPKSGITETLVKTQLQETQITKQAQGASCMGGCGDVQDMTQCLAF